MKSIVEALLALPKSLWVNFRYLPFKQAVKLPILLAPNAALRAEMGGIMLPEKIFPGMVRVGFFSMNVCNTHDRTVIEVNGNLTFKGKAALGRGTKITVNKGCTMVLGNDFKVSGYSSFVCKHKMTFGDNVLYGWECLTMDGDGHCIFDENNAQIKNAKPIDIGDNVWIGCRSTILKGSVIPANSVVGAGTIISGQEFRSNSVIAGNPPRMIKRITGWEL